MKIDWSSVGQIALVAGLTYVGLRAVEGAFPVVQNITRLPDKLLTMVSPPAA